MLYVVSVVGVIIGLALTGCGKSSKMSGITKRANIDNGSNTSENGGNNNDKVVAYSFTGGKAVPIWDIDAYKTVRVMGKVTANPATENVDPTKINVKVSCGTGSNAKGGEQKTTSADFTTDAVYVGIKNSDVKADSILDCKITVMYDKETLTTDIVWDVIKLGSLVDDKSSYGCDRLVNFFVVETNNKLMASSSYPTNNRGHAIEESHYEGGCTVDGKHVVGKAHFTTGVAPDETGVTQYWGASYDYHWHPLVDVVDTKPDGNYFFKKGEMLYHNIP